MKPNETGWVLFSTEEEDKLYRLEDHGAAEPELVEKKASDNDLATEPLEVDTLVAQLQDAIQKLPEEGIGKLEPQRAGADCGAPVLKGLGLLKVRRSLEFLDKIASNEREGLRGQRLAQEVNEMQGNLDEARKMFAERSRQLALMRRNGDNDKSSARGASASAPPNTVNAGASAATSAIVGPSPSSSISTTAGRRTVFVKFPSGYKYDNEKYFRADHADVGKQIEAIVGREAVLEYTNKNAHGEPVQHAEALFRSEADAAKVVEKGEIRLASTGKVVELRWFDHARQGQACRPPAPRGRQGPSRPRSRSRHPRLTRSKRRPSRSRLPRSPSTPPHRREYTSRQLLHGSRRGVRVRSRSRRERSVSSRVSRSRSSSVASRRSRSRHNHGRPERRRVSSRRGSSSREDSLSVRKYRKRDQGRLSEDDPRQSEKHVAPDHGSRDQHRDTSFAGGSGSGQSAVITNLRPLPLFVRNRDQAAAGTPDTPAAKKTVHFEEVNHEHQISPIGVPSTGRSSLLKEEAADNDVISDESDQFLIDGDEDENYQLAEQPEDYNQKSPAEERERDEFGEVRSRWRSRRTRASCSTCASTRSPPAAAPTTGDESGF
ncbi:unnamed protein product [Amoebophrya sp. A120]|nr:unnamed protein product [Amoebophrya sp. A120]|eukprot:GSA120T00004912001.1